MKLLQFNLYTPLDARCDCGAEVVHPPGLHFGLEKGNRRKNIVDQRWLECNHGRRKTLSILNNTHPWKIQT
ncbi:unnamed protein product [Nippostrongylus brasiliensis]|uniref:Zn_Tnp_IS1 domain-containing protein n=1 Tax=Nippostrongylus brasiliensis TaxID=27835 RepID=A0A0N4YP09_NIPBR|nr:unnamed protein product [Nippostrongylus brasiliensis]